MFIRALPLFALLAGSLAAQAAPPARPAARSVPERIADNFQTLFGRHPGFRITHAKGLVVAGTFTPSATARNLSTAAHFAAAVPVTVRFSNGTGVPTIPDTDPNAYPIGIAVRFALPGGRVTDIVANSHDGFVVATGEEMAEFLDAIIASPPNAPTPTPIERFLGTHPAALKFVTDPKPAPVSFATERWFGNNALTFVNAKGVKQVGRYRIEPAAGARYLTEAERKAAGPNYLYDELPKRLAAGPVSLRLQLQLPNPGDQTRDGSRPWPADRRVVELGTLVLKTVAPDNAALQRQLAFSPLALVDGIQLADDPLVAVRAQVYAISVARRAATK